MVLISTAPYIAMERSCIVESQMLYAVWTFWKDHTCPG